MNPSFKPELDKIISYSCAGLIFFLALISFPAMTTHSEARFEDNSQAAAIRAFASTTLQAQAAYVYDLKDQKALFQKNEAASLPLASLTKLMTALTALKQAPTSTVIRINSESLAEDGDSGLLGDEQWLMPDLLAYMLVISSNDGAMAIAHNLGDQNLEASNGSREQQFVKKMNETAQGIGLTDTRFFNPTGLDLDHERAGAYGSAQDMAKLLATAVRAYPEIMKATGKPSISVSSLSNFSHSGTNTDILASTLGGLMAGKTGYTELAGGNLAVVVDIGDRPVVIVVLGSTYDGRFTDIEHLVERAKKAVPQPR